MGFRLSEAGCVHAARRAAISLGISLSVEISPTKLSILCHKLVCAFFSLSHNPFARGGVSKSGSYGESTWLIC